MDLKTMLDSTLSRATQSGDVPGVIATVADDGGVIYEGAFGERAIGGGVPMTMDTVAWFASMTKAVTGAAAMQLIEFGIPLLTLVVPSTGSSAMSNRGEPTFHVPSRSPLKIPGASSLIPSPMTTSPLTSIRSNMPRIASQAAASAASLFPLPIHCRQLRAAISVARRKSNS